MHWQEGRAAPRPGRCRPPPTRTDRDSGPAPGPGGRRRRTRSRRQLKSTFKPEAPRIIGPHFKNLLFINIKQRFNNEILDTASAIQFIFKSFH